MRSLRAIVREQPWLSTFAVATLVAFTITGLLIDSSATVPYLAFLVIAMWVIAAIHARHPLSRGVLWALATWQLVHLAGGILSVGEGVLYNQQLIPVLLRYDQAVHAFGFGIATLACGEVIRSRISGPPDATIAVMATLGGLGVGATNEVFEFLASRVIETNVGGYVNTGWDLVANSVGAMVAGTWIRYGARSAPADVR